MKKALILVLAALLIAGIFAACEGSMPVSVKRNVIRLHILANSDSDADQSLKLKVRDLVLKNWGSELEEERTVKEAWTELNKLLPAIKKDISSLLDEQKAGYGVELKTGVYDFPSRDYNGVVFPEGRYQALRIELGRGAGHNWWCVMFPPLCLVGDDGEMDMEQYMDLVRALDDEGITPDTAPDAPVRSWVYDQMFGAKQWDRDFLKWAKEYWVGGDGK